MISVNTHEAKSRLSELLARIESNPEEGVIICRNGRPIARLIPWQPVSDPLKQHRELKKVEFHEDPSLPLEDSDWPADGR